MTIRVKRSKKRSWMAVGALVAYATVGSRSAALAETTTGGETQSGVAGQGQSQQPVRRFDIPAGALDVVLGAFQTASGVTVNAASDSLRDLKSPGVSGVYTAEQALRQVLRDSGIRYRFTARDAVTLEFQLLEAVIVTGKAPVSSPKYTEPLRDVPQTIAVIPKAVIEEQGATSLRDVLQNVPGLTIQAGEGGTPAGDNLTLRGFSARNDIFVDGVRDMGPQSRDPFDLEQVEVAKGPQSAYTGRGSAGGTINLVSKSPAPAPIYSGTLGFGTDATKRVTADVNQPLGDGIAFRLNAMGHDADVAGRNAVTNQRWGVAPSLAFGLGGKTRLTLGYFHMEQDNLSDYGIPWVPVTNNALVAYRDKPAPVPRDTYYGLTSRDHEDLGADLATLKFEHDFDGSLRLRNQLRFGKSSRDSIATPPRFASTDSTAINRELRSWIADDEIWDNQLDLVARFKTGGLEHTLVTGLDLTHENNIRKIRTAPNMPTTLLDPNPSDVFTDPITPGPYVGDITGKSVAVYAFDALKLAQKWELSGGLRWDYFDADGVSTVPAPVSRIDRMVSGRAGLVYKPREHGSIYASYGTSLDPSLEGLSYSTANTQIDPEKTYTAEIGTKWDLAGERLSLTGAIFRVDKTNARTPGLSPDEPPQVLDGEQRVKGIEVGATGSITSHWRIFGAYTLLDSEILKSNTPAEVGKHLTNTPLNAMSLWTTYELPRRIAVGGGVRFIDRRYGNTINTRWVDSYWLVDAMASFPVTSKMGLRLNVYNVTNQEYFDRLSGGHVVPGTSRAAALSTTLRF